VSEEKEKVYRFAPLSEYSLKERLLIYLADRVFFLLITLIGKTVRFEIEGWENFEAIANNGDLPIYTFWHNKIFLGTYFFRGRGIVVVTSQSFDGEYIARFIQRFGYGAVRGSSTRGGAGALIESIRCMRAGRAAGFTVDGPKGPRYEAKTGPVVLAKKTGNPMMPFTVEAKNSWTVKSWDALQIPRPFTRAKLIIGKPIYVPRDAGDAETEKKRRELQDSLDELTAFGEQWRKGNTD
jgi:lysophospholipid acyltransferase (LPLAT)-like uncharacterized protein